MSITAASILAKRTRAALMTELDQKYPSYGFSKHKGYPFKEHTTALAKLGACPIHRRSYAPVRQALGLPPLAGRSRARPNRSRLMQDLRALSIIGAEIGRGELRALAPLNDVLAQLQLLFGAQR